MKALMIFLKGILMGICDTIPGISGGTITSEGVNKMLEERLNNYLPYLKNN